VDVRRKKISVIGGARSGLAVARLLQRHGAEVFVSDSGPAERMENAGRMLEQLGIPHEFGAHSKRLLEADAVVLSPGVPSGAPIVRDLLAKGIPVRSEVEAASWFCAAPILAITGTNGKTTTTTLTGRIFSDAKRDAAVGGNIGTAFSDIVEGLTAEGVAILEVSSFQLDHIDRFRPRVAVILNITPDHLDRYEKSFEKYAQSKCRIFENQTGGDTVIYNLDDAETRTRVEKNTPSGVHRLPFSTRRQLGDGASAQEGMLIIRAEAKETRLLPVEEISIRGEHNLYNAMAASLAAYAMGVSPASIRATLRNFKGVEHRLEFVRELNGVRYINDSKATNVDSVWYAVRSFDAPQILLLGGRDKGNDYSTLDEPVRRHVRAIVAIGESSAKVRDHFSRLVPVDVASSMEEAVHTAARRAQPGDIVLLSPACASFDWFENYEHRGKVFKEIVHAMSAG
jgi:UDP-N-acetylmuramoylalanine--D-glutamate ligase